MRSARAIGSAFWLAIANQAIQRSVVELVITVGPFALLWFLTWAALGWSYWLSLVFAVPAAGFLVRLFMIQHDCGHGSFFRHSWRTTGWAVSSVR